jgi:hypothetical protein
MNDPQGFYLYNGDKSFSRQMAAETVGVTDANCDRSYSAHDEKGYFYSLVVCDPMRIILRHGEYYAKDYDYPSLLNIASIGAAQQVYLGFDRNDYPGDSLLSVLRERFDYTSYWLNNPPGRNQNTWAGKLSLLKQKRFGF